MSGLVGQALEMPDDLDDQLAVLVSVPNDKKELKVEWVGQSDTRAASCQISTGTNTLALSQTLLQAIQTLVKILRSVVCDKSEFGVSKLELKCTAAVKNDLVYPVSSTFLSLAYCSLENIKPCPHYVLTEGTADCTNGYIKLLDKLHEVLFKNQRQRRDLFYSLDSNAVIENIDVLKENLLFLDTNMQYLKSSLFDLITNVDAQQFNYSLIMHKLGRELINSDLEAAVDLLHDNKNEAHLAMIEYNTVITNMLSRVSTALVDMSTLSQGQAVCRMSDGETHCMRDIPQVTCTPHWLKISSRVELVQPAQVKKVFCVPCFEMTNEQTGLSSANGHFIIQQTNDFNIMLLSDGTLLETGVSSDEFNGKVSELVQIHHCWFNVLAGEDTVMLACKKSLSLTNTRQEITKLKKYQLVILQQADFPIHLSGYLVTLDQVIESVERKEIEIVTKGIKLPTLYSRDSLPYLLEDLSYQQMKIPLTFMEIVHKYTEMKIPFYSAIGTITAIIVSCAGWILFKCIPHCRRCVFSSRQAIGVLRGNRRVSESDVEDQANQVEMQPMVPRADRSTQVNTRRPKPVASPLPTSPPAYQ